MQKQKPQQKNKFNVCILYHPPQTTQSWYFCYMCLCYSDDDDEFFFVKVIVVVVCDVTIILWTLFGRHLWLSFHLKFSLS